MKLSRTSTGFDARKPVVLLIAASLDPRAGSGRMGYELVMRLKAFSKLTTVVGRHARTSELGEELVLEPHRRFSAFARNCWRVRRAARGADVVHALDGWPYGAYGFFAVVGTRRSLVISGVGTYAVAPLDEGGFRGWLLARAYRRAKAVPCISHYTESRLRSKLPRVPTSVVHLGMTRIEPPTPAAVAAFRKRMNLPGDSFPVVLSVGAIKERKGQLDTLRGLLAAKEKYPNFFYLVVGSDADAEYISRMKELAERAGASDRLRIAPDIKNDAELSAAYAVTDLFALNSNNEGSHFEGFGLVFLEAGQFGVPGIGSRNCGIEDAIVDGHSGVLVDQKDPDDFVRAVATILSKRAEYSDGARKFADSFSWDKTVSAYRKIYES